MSVARTTVGALAAALVLSLGVVLVAASEPGGGEPRAWIDLPAPPALLPMGPVDVILHATDASGIAQVEFSVDEEQAELHDMPEALTLVEYRLVWLPESEGPHVLRARAKGRGGQWGTSAEVIVIVGARAQTPTPGPQVSPTATPTSGSTPAPTDTPSPSITPSPTPRVTREPTPSPTPRVTPSPTPPITPSPAPCTPPAPTLLEPNNGLEISDPALDRPTFRWTYRGGPPDCAPSGYQIQLDDDDEFGSPLYDETLPAAEATWTPPLPLPDCATYYWRVLPLRSDGAQGPASSIWNLTLFIGRCT